VRSRGTTTVLTLLVAVTLAPLIITNAHAIQGCQPTSPQPTCYLYAQTNVPSAEGSVIVRQDGNNALEYPLPHLFAFTNGTTHSLEVLTLTVSGTPSGARYLWDSHAEWILHGLQWTPAANMTTPQMVYNYTLPNDQFTAQFDKEFQYTLTFTDHNGAALSPAPASITLSGPTGTLTTSAYSGQWLQAASWTVVDAKWEGVPGLVVGAQTIDLTSGPVTKSIQLAVYPATLKVVDLNNNPLSGANVTVTFAPPNSTRVSHLTGIQGTVGLGEIPLGPYTAHVTYQGLDMGTWSKDASTNPLATVQVNYSPPPPPPTPPSWPSGSALTISNVNFTSLRLTWTAATGPSGVANYRILQGVTVIATVSGNVTSYTVTGLTPGNSYQFQIQAVDSSGNVSPNGLFQTGTTPVQQTSTQSAFYLTLAGAIAGSGAIGASLLLLQRGRRNRSKSNRLLSSTPSRILLGL
jgi:hypothetical protein